MLEFAEPARSAIANVQTPGARRNHPPPPFSVTGELSTLRQMMKVPNEPGLSPNNGLEKAFLSNQSVASNPRKGQAKLFSPFFWGGMDIHYTSATIATSSKTV